MYEDFFAASPDELDDITNWMAGDPESGSDDDFMRDISRIMSDDVLTE